MVNADRDAGERCVRGRGHQTNAPEFALNIKNTGNAPASIGFAQPANTECQAPSRSPAAPTSARHFPRGSRHREQASPRPCKSLLPRRRQSDSTVTCFGDGGDAKLGTNTCVGGGGGNVGQPGSPVTNVTTATDVSAGAAGTCAIIAGGSVHCWDFGGTAPATVIGF